MATVAKPPRVTAGESPSGWRRVDAVLNRSNYSLDRFHFQRVHTLPAHQRESRYAACAACRSNPRFRHFRQESAALRRPTLYTSVRLVGHELRTNRAHAPCNQTSLESQHHKMITN